MILIIDFGSQTTHLIGRRIRELGAKIEICTPDETLDKIKKHKPKGIILSGGPASVYETNAPSIDKVVFSLNIPILGICYGLQLIAVLLNGVVKPGKKKEFGPATLLVEKNNALLNKLPNEFKVWMSHGDRVTKIPQGFINLARTKTIPFAVISHPGRKIYGLQFHPEVIHTQFGQQILQNFLEICQTKIQKQKINKKFVEGIVENLRDSLHGKKAISGLSGGVDSSVASLLVHQAIGQNLQSIYIDSGLMRQNETETLQKVFTKYYRMFVKVVHAQDIFLERLRGIIDPEQKRKIIGNTFIDVFEREAKYLKAEFLVQGTIYPDVIESSGSKHSDKIKSHHNVAGLPEKMNLALIEPLRSFYKDEVRKIGQIIKLPDEIIKRHPFPGPGLAIRIIGAVTKIKLQILRKADWIIQEETQKTKLSQNLWQVFAVFTGIKTTGVKGDQRHYGETIAIRAVETKDVMTANFAHLPYPLLDRITTRIVNEIKEVNRVVYDITNKPPATVEWE